MGISAKAAEEGQKHNNHSSLEQDVSRFDQNKIHRVHGGARKLGFVKYKPWGTGIYFHVRPIALVQGEAGHSAEAVKAEFLDLVS